MILIDGEKISQDILSSVKEEIGKLPFVPVFCDVLVGEDFASVKYVKMKARVARKLGISFKDASFPDSITTDELVNEIKKLNATENMCGIIVQLPLPLHIDKKAVLDAIDPKLDVDCLGKERSEMFYKGNYEIGFPAALASMAVLDSLRLDLSTKKIVVLGQGELVGRPTTAILRFKGLEPIPVDRATPNKESLIKGADIIISGVGQPKYITGDMIKKGVVIIDAGTSEVNNSLSGDADTHSLGEIAGALSPVPGGVGPVTVAILFKNVLEVAKTKNG